MAWNIENYIPLVKWHGFNTNKPASFGSTVSFATAPTGPKQASVLSGQASTVTLTAAQSGYTALFDSAAGIVYTLPAPVVGMTFDFIVVTTITSNAAKVITNTGTVLLIGDIFTTATDSSNATKGWVGNGSSHIAVSMNGTTTGGYQGAILQFKCVSSTLWEVSGSTPATGTVATPFSTS